MPFSCIFSLQCRAPTTAATGADIDLVKLDMGMAGGEDKEAVGRWTVFYYGVGHMLNDITSACWFTYLLVFLTEIGLPPSDAALVMLSSQIADGLTTIFAGELIDRYGGFKVWHGTGSLLVAFSFSSVFGGCLPCKLLGSYSPFTRTVSYSFFAAVFNVGWAATQVSHMSMVNCITLNSTSRAMLTSCRNAFTMVANLSVYAIAFVVFNINTKLSVADVEFQYQWIAYASILLGCCFVGVFLLGTEEPRLKQEAYEKGQARISWTYWFNRALYYQVALVYVLTRLVGNVSQAFLAFYIVNDLQMSRSSKALVPAVIYISSFIVSILLQEIAWTGRSLKALYFAGGLLWMISGTGILILPSTMSGFVYVLSVAIGIANTLMMVSGITMQSFLVGDDLHGCAFVYGSLSFLDKILCGLALSLLESYQRSTLEMCNCISQSPLSMTRYGLGLVSTRSTPEMCSCILPAFLSVTRYGLGLVPIICSLIGILVTLSMKLPEAASSKTLIDPLLA